MNVMRLHFIPAVLALIFVFTALGFYGQIKTIYRSTTPAIEWQGVEVITQTVRPGETLDVVYTAVINKQCPADLRGFLIAPDGTVPVRFPVVAGGYSKPSEGPIKISVSIGIPTAADPGLRPLSSGPHTYRTIATRYCPEGVEEDSAVPDAPFNLSVE